MRISRVLFSGLAAAAVAVGFAGSASAQSDTLRVQKPIRIKLGAFFPTDGDVKDAIGETFFSYGVSYDFGKSTATNPLIYSAYIDGATKSKKYGDARARLTYTGVGPALRAYLNPATSQPRYFAGLGLGAYFVNAKVNVGDFSDSQNETRFGGKIFGGVEFNGGFFGEADYTYISEVDGVQPGGFNLSIGYRF